LTLTDKLLPEAPDFWVKDFHIDGFYVLSENTEYRASDLSDIIWICDSNLTNKSPQKRTFSQNLGFTRELSDYLSTDPYFRAGKHNRLTFPLLYAFSKRFVLTNLAKNEQNSSLFSYMFGSDTTKFSNMRLFFAVMMTYPGKKSLCAENIFPNEYVEPDNLFEHANSKQAFYKYLASLNKFYLDHPSLWENDFSKEGFEWVCNDRGGDSVLAYKRIGNNRKEVVSIFNFSSSFRKKYRIAICGRYVYYREIFNSDSECFGGADRLNNKTITRLDGSVEIDLPPLSAIIIEPIYLD
jgi:1,4-alpha-glucan branching enzyme